MLLFFLVFSECRRWFSDCCLTLTFQLYHGKSKLIFYEMILRSALYQTNMLSWIFIVQAHRSNSPRIDMLPQLATLSRFWANQSLLFLLNAECLAEKQQIPILQSLVWPVKPMIYHTQGNHANHNTTHVVEGA